MILNWRLVIQQHQGRALIIILRLPEQAPTLLISIPEKKQRSSIKLSRGTRQFTKKLIKKSKNNLINKIKRKGIRMERSIQLGERWMTIRTLLHHWWSKTSDLAELKKQKSMVELMISFTIKTSVSNLATIESLWFTKIMLSVAIKKKRTCPSSNMRSSKSVDSTTIPPVRCQNL